MVSGTPALTLVRPYRADEFRDTNEAAKGRGDMAPAEGGPTKAGMNQDRGFNYLLVRWS